MPRGDKSSYTDKQKRMAEHIEDGYEKRGALKKEAEARAGATVNKETHGGKKSGSGRGTPETIHPRARAAVRAAPRRPRDRRPSDLHPRRRRPQPASERRRRRAPRSGSRR